MRRTVRASWLLVPCIAMVTAKLPMGFLVLLAGPLAVLALQGIRPHARWPRALALTLLWSLLASFVAVVSFAPQLLAGTNNTFVVMVAIAALASCVFASGERPDEVAARLVDGLFAGLLVTWALSMVEVATGFKFMTVLYPGANTIAQVAGRRLFVSALFPNYNDYSVAMAMLVVLMVARLLFQRRGPRTTLLRWVVLISATFLVAYMGSRGALATLLGGIVLVCTLNVRALHGQVLPLRARAAAVLLGGAALLGLLTSPYVQDNSTAQRGGIAENILTMLGDQPVRALLGYGALSQYLADAAARFGAILMDPHNLLLELVIWYGLPALVGFLTCWWMVVRSSFLGSFRPGDWRSVGAVSVTTLLPLIGIVCSSTLRYHIVWIWLLASVAAVHAHRRAAAQASAAPEAAMETSRSISPA
ncbi:O-antigen ligase domain-containing protein [Luteococcus peritonei]|uniref:O-antigen ligase family protein n=1 Tax=Luteococcus peritonei TaxID=88874 RepID=A0ABW4RY87_9ACTN